jgi:plasmid stability protein
MANLTVTIEDEVLRKARIRALEQGTSVNALLREYLRAYASEEAKRAMEEIVTLASKARSSSGKGGRTWTRDELHERD